MMGLCSELQQIVVCFLLFLQKGTSVYSQASGQSPMFDVPVVNVTAVAGKTAILPCIVNNNKNNQVAWMDPRNKVLSLSDQRIIHDLRMTVERPFKHEWNLHIRSVRKNDSGEYLCQINTSPVKSKKIILIVFEPPMIVEDAGNREVMEGSNVELWCRVYGTPMPVVTWYRTYMYDRHMAKEAIGEPGEQLNIYNVTRYCEDEYECEAHNGIDPPARRKMKVTVEFPPEVELPTQRMSQAKGKETILDCRIEANPFGTIVWMKEGRELSNNGKYGIQIYEDEERYRKTLSLRINNLADKDFSVYRCFATNALGNDHGDMTLSELRPRLTTTTTRRPPFKTTHKNKFVYDDADRNTKNYWDPSYTYNEQGKAEKSTNRCGRVSASLVVVVHSLTSLLFITLVLIR